MKHSYEVETLTIYSSNGELCVDVATGLVDKGASDYYDTDELKHISQFDIEEFCVFWNCEPQEGDILDFGYWMDDGTYEPPAMDWRLDIAVQFLADDIEWEDFGPMTPGEILELALNGKAFGAIPKETNEFKNAIREAGLDPDQTSSMETFTPSFWRTSQYENYEEAVAQGGVYQGEVCYGYTSYTDAMINVKAAIHCLDGAWETEGLMVHLLIDGVVIGDLSIGGCC